MYDDANLVLSIQKAIVEFRDPWRARLGIRSRSDIPSEHWTRVKALTRRFFRRCHWSVRRSRPSSFRCSSLDARRIRPPELGRQAVLGLSEPQ